MSQGGSRCSRMVVEPCLNSLFNPALKRSSCTPRHTDRHWKRAAMSTAFLFIDATKTDAGTRRKARSHAMKGKNVGKKHSNRRTKKAIQFRPTIHDLDRATSIDSDPQKDEYMQDFLLPISPALLYTIEDDFIIPMHLQTNATPQSQHVIRQCEWAPQASDGGN